jgi:hypothetical protein
MITETFACRRLENLWPPPGARHNLLLGDNSSGGHGDRKYAPRTATFGYVVLYRNEVRTYRSRNTHIPEIQMLEVLKPKSVKQNIGKVSQVRHSLLR